MLAIAVSDAEAWFDMYDQVSSSDTTSLSWGQLTDVFLKTMMIMNQFRVDSRGQTNPVQAVLGKNIPLITSYMIPDWIMDGHLDFPPNLVPPE